MPYRPQEMLVGKDRESLFSPVDTTRYPRGGDANKIEAHEDRAWGHRATVASIHNSRLTPAETAAALAAADQANQAAKEAIDSKEDYEGKHRAAEDGGQLVAEHVIELVPPREDQLPPTTK